MLPAGSHSKSRQFFRIIYEKYYSTKRTVDRLTFTAMKPISIPTLLLTLTLSLGCASALTQSELNQGESEIRRGGANFLYQGSSVGGILYLTDQRIIFKSHGYNQYVGHVKISLSSITDVQVNNSISPISNGMCLTMTDNSQSCLLVFSRDEWIEAIKKAMAPTR